MGNSAKVFNLRNIDRANGRQHDRLETAATIQIVNERCYTADGMRKVLKCEEDGWDSAPDSGT